MSITAWTALPPELLELIASKLPAIDCAQFRASSRAFAAACPVLAPKAPFLLLPGGPGERSTFLCVADGTSYRARVPGLDAKKHCVGSQHGWLVTLDASSEPALLNPVTGQEVELPSMATLPYIRHARGPDGSIASISLLIRPDHDEWDEYAPEEFLRLSLWKAVLSRSPSAGDGFVVAALFGLSQERLVFTRSGDERWHTTEESFREIGFHRGRLFGVNSSGLYTVRLDGASATSHMVSRGRHGRTLAELRAYLFTDHESGDLLLARREYRYERRRPVTCRIDLERFDFEHGTWSAVEGLGRRALFVGLGAPVLVAAEDVAAAGLRRNAAYFNDDWWDMMYAAEDGAATQRDVGVYHFGDRSCEPCHPPHPCFHWPPPIWISTALPLGLSNFEVEKEDVRWDSSDKAS